MRNAEAIADLERLDQILVEIEVDPHVVQIDQCHQWDARRNVFTKLHVAFWFGQVRSRFSPALVPRMSMHYHSLLATFGTGP
jgi:hypothetical protein